MKMSPDALFQSAEIYFESFDFEAGTVKCHQMQRNDYARSSFLDHRTLSAGPTLSLKTSDLYKACLLTQSKPKPVTFIFHIAFGGSTLISRCLDKDGVCLSYKEPYLLHQLAFLARNNLGLKTTDSKEEMNFKVQLPAIIINLLSRSFSPDEIPMIKPTESCNNLIAPLLKTHPNARAILLYGNLKAYVISLLKDTNRRTFMRESLSRAQADFKAIGYDNLLYDGLTDGQSVGYLWLSQMVHFYKLLQNEDLNLRSLSSPDFFDSPVETLSAISNFFGMNHTEDDFQKHVDHGAFTKYSKEQHIDYDAAAALKFNQKKAELLKPEIDEARAWVSDMSHIISIPNSLPRPLI